MWTLAHTSGWLVTKDCLFLTQFDIDRLLTFLCFCCFLCCLIFWVCLLLFGFLLFLIIIMIVCVGFLLLLPLLVCNDVCVCFFRVPSSYYVAMSLLFVFCWLWFDIICIDIIILLLFLLAPVFMCLFNYYFRLRIIISIRSIIMMTYLSWLSSSFIILLGFD